MPTNVVYYSYYQVPNKYYWIYVMGCINSFADGCGIGMNDMANSFGTVYGSKVLNKWQICLLASICEFTGAMALGKAVSDTISGGIANSAMFKYNPYCLMWGFLCALAASTSWLYFATSQKLKVSTTHSIVGGILGFCIAFGGTEGVIWKAPKDTFPYIKGFCIVAITWVASPIFCALISIILYGTLKIFVLRGDNAALRAVYGLPVFMLVTFFIESFLIITKGAGSSLIDWSTDMSHVSWVSVVIGAVAAVASIPFIPIINKLRIKEEERIASGADRVFKENVEFSWREGNFLTYSWQEFWRSRYDTRLEYVNDKKHIDLEVVEGTNPSYPQEVVDKPTKKADTLVDPNDFQQYSPGVEYVFRYLQVFTAMCMSFAHGSNDVANAAGPLAAIVYIYNTGTVTSSVPVEQWCLALSAAGIVVGLTVYGQKIMELLGDDLTYITPVRGFCAELSAAWVITLCAAYGMPVSTSQCITGAIIGVSLLDIPIWKLQFRVMGKIFTSWLLTIIIVGMGSAALFSVGIHSPVKYSDPKTADQFR